MALLPVLKALSRSRRPPLLVAPTFYVQEHPHVLDEIIVTMITSKMFRAGHASRVTVLVSSPEDQQSDLLVDSVIMADNLATVLESEIDRVIGSLPMDSVDSALAHTLGLSLGVTA